MSITISTANPSANVPDATIVATYTTADGEVEIVKANSGTTLATSQATITGPAVQIVAANTARRAVIIANLGAIDVYLGTAAVTTATGLLLLGTKGTAISIPTTAAVYGIVSAGSVGVSVMEIRD